MLGFVGTERKGAEYDSESWARRFVWCLRDAGYWPDAVLHAGPDGYHTMEPKA
jgi:hypothetical protein